LIECDARRHSCDLYVLCEEVPGVTVNSEDEIFHATATSGHSLQLACDVNAAQNIVWTRLGVSLHNIPQFKASCSMQSVVCQS